VEPIALITMRPKSGLRAVARQPSLREALGTDPIQT
jgi:hypothetical protein